MSIHGLLKNGAVDFDWEFYAATECELVLRGPVPGGAAGHIAVGGPMMLQLVAKYADAWDWWGWDETLEQVEKRLAPIIHTLEQACKAEGRDPSSVGRTFDWYAVVPEGFDNGIGGAEGLDMKQPVTGTSEEIAEHILSIGRLGFDEVRCDV